MSLMIKIMPRSSIELRPHRIIALAYDRLSTFEFSIAIEVFGMPQPDVKHWYKFDICALDKGYLQARGGIEVVSPRLGVQALREADTILIPGWSSPDVDPPKELVSELQRAYRRGARIVSFCSGAFVVAAAGLLDGKSATTHWRYADSLAKRYPSIHVRPDVLYVDEESILTAAGSAAAIDLSLHVVRKDFGTKLANDIARRLVIQPHREGGQAQFIQAPIVDPAFPWLANLFDWVQTHIHEDLTIKRLADKARMSQRTFIRHFESACGSSPGEWILKLRIRRAKELLEMTNFSIEDIAARCGFGSSTTLQHHFRNRLHLSPTAYRLAFKA
jgi:AraC family transcriptional regulator, transcriptional activator FtrA